MGHKNNFSNQNSGGGGNIGGGGGGGHIMGNKSMGNNMNNSGNIPNPFISSNKKFKSVLNGGVLQGYASAREIRAKYPNANDCEIVVMEKSLV